MRLQVGHSSCGVLEEAQNSGPFPDKEKVKAFEGCILRCAERMGNGECSCKLLEGRV